MTTREAIIQIQYVLSLGKLTWTGVNDVRLEIEKAPLDFESLRSVRDFGLQATLATQTAQRLFDSDGSGSIQAGSAIELTVPRQWRKLVIARDMKDLLSFPNAPVSVPAAYLLLELQKGKSAVTFVEGDITDNLPPVQHRYHQAVELWSILKSSADHVNAEGNLMFFGPKPSEIMPGFEIVNLERSQLWEPGIRKFILDQDRREVRQQIFRACLGDLLRDTTPDHAFRTFLQSTDVFERHLREGMAMYLADNTPEKLATEGRISAMALSESLEKIIGGLEAKGLTIPAALLLAVKDMQPGTGIGGLNAVISMSLLIFAVTMFFIDSSQRALIRQLITTIDDATKGFKRKGLEESNPVINERFKNLRARAENAKCWSAVICGVSVLPFLVVLYMSLCGTPRPVAQSEVDSQAVLKLTSEKK